MNVASTATPSCTLTTNSIYIEEVQTLGGVSANDVDELIDGDIEYSNEIKTDAQDPYVKATYGFCVRSTALPDNHTEDKYFEVVAELEWSEAQTLRFVAVHAQNNNKDAISEGEGSSQPTKTVAEYPHIHKIDLYAWVDDAWVLQGQDEKRISAYEVGKKWFSGFNNMLLKMVVLSQFDLNVTTTKIRIVYNVDFYLKRFNGSATDALNFSLGEIQAYTEKPEIGLLASAVGSEAVSTMVSQFLRSADDWVLPNTSAENASDSYRDVLATLYWDVESADFKVTPMRYGWLKSTNFTGFDNSDVTDTFFEGVVFTLDAIYTLNRVTVEFAGLVADAFFSPTLPAPEWSFIFRIQYYDNADEMWKNLLNRTWIGDLSEDTPFAVTQGFVIDEATTVRTDKVRVIFDGEWTSTLRTSGLIVQLAATNFQVFSASGDEVGVLFVQNTTVAMNQLEEAPVRVWVEGEAYAPILVATSDAQASAVRMYDGSTVKALKKYL